MPATEGKEIRIVGLVNVGVSVDLCGTYHVIMSPRVSCKWDAVD